mmetsp:Transcript_162207/g.394076  ORF Transcript_162207/g.394076 Transcript_162207/m.394076 type:complete len:354 (+) Transcript_162207:33-1094(+)
MQHLPKCGPSCLLQVDNQYQLAIGCLVIQDRTRPHADARNRSGASENSLESIAVVSCLARAEAAEASSAPRASAAASSRKSARASASADSACSPLLASQSAAALELPESSLATMSAGVAALSALLGCMGGGGGGSRGMPEAEGPGTCAGCGDGGPTIRDCGEPSACAPTARGRAALLSRLMGSSFRSARLTRPQASERCSSKIWSRGGKRWGWPVSSSVSKSEPPTVRKSEAMPASKTRSSQRRTGAVLEPRTTSCRVEIPQTLSVQVSLTSACSLPTKPKKTRTQGGSSRSRTASAERPRKSFLPLMETNLSPARTPTRAAWPPSRTPATTTCRRLPPPRSTTSSLGDSPSW